MKTIKLAILVFLITVNYQTLAQDKAIRLYTNFLWYSYSSDYGSSSYSNFGKITPSFSMNTEKGNFHEFELTSFSFGKSSSKKYTLDTNTNAMMLISGSNNNAQIFGVKYEFSLKLLKKSTSKLQPYIGFATNVNFRRSARNPVLATMFYSNSTSLYTAFFITPRLIYNLNEKWFFDFNVPFNLANFGVYRSRYLNPNIPVNNQITYSTDFKFIPRQFTFKLGVGYKF